MTFQDLQNIRRMLDRVPVTGPEAIVWCQAVAGLEAEIKRLTPPAQLNGHAQPPIDNAHVAPGCEQFSEGPTQ